MEEKKEEKKEEKREEKREEKEKREDTDKSSTNHKEIKKIISDPDRVEEEKKKYTEDE